MKHRSARWKPGLTLACKLLFPIGQKARNHMQTLPRSEHYTDKGCYAVMTRTAVVNYAQLTRVADQLRRDADDLASSTNPPTLENCRIAGAMVGWAFNLVPRRIQTSFDY